jgi:hypothetical protein
MFLIIDHGIAFIMENVTAHPLPDRVGGLVTGGFEGYRHRGRGEDIGGAKGCESRCTVLLAGRGSLWGIDGRDWPADWDFSDTILGLDTIPGLGVVAF